MEEETYSGLDNGEMDSKVVQTFQRSFVQVQDILDQNRSLIIEINQNHESNTRDKLTRNVGLIRELNNNIRTVAGLYADLSSSITKSMAGSGSGSGASAASSEEDSSAAMKLAGNKRNRPA